MTIDDFVKAYRIRLAVEWADSNPNFIDDEWARSARHWRCTLRCGRRRMSLYFSQGCAHTEEPTAADILDCLASDASSIENAPSFEEWARDMGYDADSRKAEKTWKAINLQTARLRGLLADPAVYDELLYHVDRL